MLVDKRLLQVGPTIISPFAESQVQAIGYDLQTKCFYRESEETEVTRVTLQPLDSIFVQCKEQIHLPDDMSARVVLRNSRIRQGLSLTAPIYYPGHKTPVYFRLTNISSKAIRLDVTDGFATVLLDQLSDSVAKPYTGTFQTEERYRGMGSYQDVYAAAMKEVRDKFEDLRSLEKRLYINMLAIMAIFVALFSIININVSLVEKNLNLSSLLIFNLSTVASIAFLLACVQCLFSQISKKIVILLGLSLLLFGVAIALL